ncbi:Mut7-C RNAse domain-containing protein [Halobellus sp. GM3]|uniref:Mut7-C RNAse domain-containing protein n=1 Tax=Halobellus sp. GM3 TaxID=3458410 RepID=UPI00403D8EF8
MTARLLLDAMLGKLSTYLRMCGYDAEYVLDDSWGSSRTAQEPSDDEILRRARESDRTLLTRDVDLAARAPDAVLLSTREVRDQLRELRESGYALSLENPPTRCGACNGELAPVDAGASLPPYAPDPAETDCWRCLDCGQAFWRGSHWDDVGSTLAAL